MNGDHFSRFEAHVQRLIEGGFARLFAGRLHPREVLIQLARAMEDHTAQLANGERRAPEAYVVRLNPEDHRAILAGGEDVAARLAEELVEMARASNLSLARVPEVRLLSDPAVQPHAVAISAQHAAAGRQTTQVMPLRRLRGRGESKPPQATLLLDGDRQVVLDKPVINLGRQRDNDVIVDDPTVSRHHAQIRLRFGNYVLFDLGSSGGTTVNGHPVQERVLQSGDVIGLARSRGMLYIEDGGDEAERGAPGDTEAYPPVRP